MLLVIGRLLSYWDNRMLPERGTYMGEADPAEPISLVDNPIDDEDPLELYDKMLIDWGHKDVSDNGYSEAIIIQGLDQKYHGGES